MLQAELGFAITASPNDATLIAVRKTLAPERYETP
jgi:hypothetical protein